ncbi:hypothetical protein WBQ80_06340 [Agromyces sp. CCNWLW213]
MTESRTDPTERMPLRLAPGGIPAPLTRPARSNGAIATIAWR